MPDPTSANAPRRETGGEAKNQLAADTPILAVGTAEAKRRADIAREQQQRNARLALDHLEAGTERAWHPSDRWQRCVANELAAQGWDPEYLARRFHLARKQVAA
jgi:hypothetical protein